MRARELMAAAVAVGRFIKNPRQLDAVIRILDAMAQHPIFSRPVMEQLRAIEQGRAALRDRPRLGPIDVDALAALAPGTLGHEFARHLRKNNLDPAALPTREAVTDVEYVSAHGYETHDIWHALTGFGADAAGETGLTTFYIAQSPTRPTLAILTFALINTLVKEFDQYPVRFNAIARGWLLGRRARQLFGIDWKTMWEEPLDEVRRRFDLDVEGVDGLMAAWTSGHAEERREQAKASTRPGGSPISASLL